MANQKKPQPRQRHNPPDDDQIEQRTPQDTSDGSDDSDSDEQQVPSNQRRSGGGTEGPPPPPIFDKPVRVRSGEQYSALAATAFARFNPADKRVQLAEHWVFSDPQFKKRGYI